MAVINLRNRVNASKTWEICFLQVIVGLWENPVSCGCKDCQCKC